MLWLELVIGTALWCWWQVPARRVNGASGRFELDWRLGALAAQSHFDDRVSMGRQSAPYWKAENTLSTGYGSFLGDGGAHCPQSPAHGARLHQLDVDDHLVGAGYFVQFIDDKDGNGLRRPFYEALLKIKWFPSTIRRAVMRELGQSLQKHKRSIEDARTVTLEFLVKQCKAQMQANGERPQGGIHEAAVAQVATRQGMSPEALKQRITRHKKRPSK